MGDLCEHRWPGSGCPDCKKEIREGLGIKDAEVAAAEKDAALLGTGILVDGKRVDPSRVSIIVNKPRCPTCFGVGHMVNYYCGEELFKSPCKTCKPREFEKFLAGAQAFVSKAE